MINPENPLVTVVYIIKNRDWQKLVNSFCSIKNNTKHTFKTIVVDYGSNKDYRNQIKQACDKHEMVYLRSETQGWPWSRGHALNIGIKQASTKYIMNCDIDFYFSGDIIDACLTKIQPNSFLHCRCYFLPRSGRIAKAKKGAYAHRGFLFIEKKLFGQVYGFDERIKYWGSEDADLYNRLSAQSKQPLWLDDKPLLYHVWHPSIKDILNDRPATSLPDTHLIRMGNSIQPFKQLTWGKQITSNEHPILEYLRYQKPKTIKIENYHNDIKKVIDLKTTEKFIRLIFGLRLLDHKTAGKEFFRKFINIVNKFIRPKLGYEISITKNKNFDFWYSSLSLLRNYGLIDYYIDDDFNSVYLLFE